MQNGSTGDDVKALQTKLGVSPADGSYGPATVAAVKNYQQAHGLGVDGVAGPATLAALGLHEAPPAADPTLTPPADEPKLVEKQAPTEPVWTFTADGWLTVARRIPAFPGRIGGAIHATSIVVHTTDTTPGTMAGVLGRWATTLAEGCAAHFMLGREPNTATDDEAAYTSHALVQMVPITHNGNHAGGARKVNGVWEQFHGNYVVDGKIVHPNTMSIGIETENAGRLMWTDGTKKIALHTDSGRTFIGDDVYVDSLGRPWHKVTEYQLDMLGKLIDALDAALAPLPDGVGLKTNGTYAANGAAWAIVKGARLVGHATLDPANKTDPGPQIIDYLRSRYDI